METKTNKELISDYFNSHYKHINKDFNSEAYKKQILKYFRPLLKKEDKILDIGSGTGFLLKVLEDEGYQKLWGVERDKFQFKESQKILKVSKLYNQDIFDFFKKTNQTFNVIFMMDIIEHIPKERIIPLLKQAYSHLEKGGILILRNPNAESPLFAGRSRYADFTHEISFTQVSMRMILREAGFEDIICKSDKPYDDSFRALIAKLIRLGGNFVLRLYFASYLGIEGAMNLILTSNLITIARK